MTIYKILLPDEWGHFEAQRRFDGSPFDIRSGFIHCSSRAQVSATAGRVFPAAPALVVVALDERRLDDVRWEPAPNGGPFPHVYGSLPITAVVGSYPVDGAAYIDDTLPSG